MIGFRLALLALLLASSLTFAQPAPTTESVTVTGVKSRQVLDQFVKSFAAPSRMTGKLARWEDGICPVTAGLKPIYSEFISARVKDVAVQVGAPMNAQSGCKPNIEIVFTTAPQALMDNVRKNDEAFLGYADNSAQRDQLVKVTRPVQAWYTTGTRDLRGNIHVDSAKVAGGGAPVEVSCPDCPDGKMRFYNITAGTVTGSRLGDGMRSTLYHVIIVADPTKLATLEVGALADYISMLALTQLSSLDTCQQLPSIVNLLASGCRNPAQALTDSDLSYLRGLYKMGADGNLRTQQDEIAYQMEKALTGH
jgi:hypothetical protein